MSTACGANEAPSVSVSAARIALVGAPNCGKTALFNALTGSRQKVGNYAGVTVERKLGTAQTPAGHALTVIDLPGTYSLRARSPDEEITRDIVLGRRAQDAAPDLVVLVVDATSPRAGLRLALEIGKTGRPMLVVLNMIDIARHRGITIDLAALSRGLGIPVIAATAVRKGGQDALWQALDTQLAAGIPTASENLWTEPNGTELRRMNRAVEALCENAVRMPERPDTRTARIDAILLHPVGGILCLLLLMFLMFQAVFTGATPLMDLIGASFDALSAGVAAVVPDGLFQSFLRDGLIAGVGGVLVFLPQILILFLFILLLEDLGYMARAAFLMDRIMGGAGLHGRAFIPLLSSFACAIPGIMAARVIDNRADRLTTILAAPLVTCSARIPVYTLIISAFVPGTRVFGLFDLRGLVMFGLYATGIVAALAVSFVAKRLFLRRRPAPPFMLELPDYKIPQAKSIAIGLGLRAKIFLRRAGTTIFTMTILIWILATLPLPPEGATESAISYSFAAMIGHWIEPVMAPIGFNWEICMALVPGMAAREVAVSALGTVYALQDNATLIGQSLAQHWSLATALSFLAWFVFAPQCISTLAVIRREAGGARWMWLTFGYMLVLAYLASFITYQVAVLLGAG